MRHLNLIILLLFLLACQDKEKEEVRRLVSEWQGKEITGKQPASYTRRTTTCDCTRPSFDKHPAPLLLTKKKGGNVNVVN